MKDAIEGNELSGYKDEAGDILLFAENNFARSGQNEFRLHSLFTVYLIIILVLLCLVLLYVSIIKLILEEHDFAMGSVYGLFSIFLFVSSIVFCKNTLQIFRRMDYCINMLIGNKTIDVHFISNEVNDEMLVEIYFVMREKYSDKIGSVLDIMRKRDLIDSNTDAQAIFYDINVEIVDFISRFNLLIGKNMIYKTQGVQHVKGSVIKATEIANIEKKRVFNFDKLRSMEVVEIQYNKNNRLKRLRVFSKDNDTLWKTLSEDLINTKYSHRRTG